MSVDVKHLPLMRPVDEALAVLLRNAKPVAETEWVDIPQALGRVLGDDLYAAVDVPPWDNSAVDGYAFAWDDLQGRIDQGLTPHGRYAAGSVPDTLPPACAARVFTGSPIPSGADTVVMQEDCLMRGGALRILKSMGRGENIRRRGGDVPAGACAAVRGCRLRPQDLAAAASMGYARLPVHRRLRVGVVCTGSELVPPGQPLEPGKVYDVNHALLTSLLRGLGCEVHAAGLIGDDLDVTVQTLDGVARSVDVVITSGGVSVGEEDHVKTAVSLCGRVDWWRVAIKPGKPFAFGGVFGKPVLGLPGNPVALFVTFCVLARPFLLRMQGLDDVLPRGLVLPARFHKQGSGRREFVGARITRQDGERGLALSGCQGSARLTSMTCADGLAVIPEGRCVTAGGPVTYLPFDELLN